MIEAFREKAKAERKNGIVSAFYSAYFTRLDRLSGVDLEKVLNSIDSLEDQQMSDEDLFAKIKKFSR